MGKTSRDAGRIHYFTFWCLFFSFGYASTLLMGTWQQKRYFGPGIYKLDLSTSLNEFTVDLDCTSYLMESLGLDKKSIQNSSSDKVKFFKNLATFTNPVNKICGFFSFLNGQHSMRYARELVCGLRQSVSGVGFDFDLGCDMFTRIFLTHKVMMAVVLSCAALHFVAAICILSYWYSRPVKVLRILSVICMVISPLLAVSGLCMMVFLGGDMGDFLSPVKSAFSSASSSASLPGGFDGATSNFSILQEHKDIQQGVAMIIFASITFFALLLPLAYSTLFPIHKVEREDYETSSIEDQFAYESERQKLVITENRSAYDAPEYYPQDPSMMGQYPQDPSMMGAYQQPAPQGYGSYEQA
jgi:hypothetical protein